MNLFYRSLAILLFVTSLNATEFTVSSYNCGGLDDHYDYWRAAAMQKLMQERYIAQPDVMAANARIQKVALKALFANSAKEDVVALSEQITSLSANADWAQKLDAMISPYKQRPIVISDHEILEMVEDHTRCESMEEVRGAMAQRIFAYHLKHDIICLQEADYLKSWMFPAHYETLFSATSHSRNGIAWNTSRFELIKVLGSILGRGFAIQLRDKQTGQSVLVASGHLSGCHPYKVENNDSDKGDRELQAIVKLFEDQDAHIKIIGMDSNVTALHPRLKILKDAGYDLDVKNYLEPTCSNPNLVLDTRIDWIAVKSRTSRIQNIPVLSVGLNSIQTNISDHKPIAAKITCRIGA